MIFRDVRSLGFMSRAGFVFQVTSVGVIQKKKYKAKQNKTNIIVEFILGCLH